MLCIFSPCNEIINNHVVQLFFFGQYTNASYEYSENDAVHNRLNIVLIRFYIMSWYVFPFLFILGQIQPNKEAGCKRDLGTCSSTLVLSERYTPVPNADLGAKSDTAILHSILRSLYPFSLPRLQWGQMDL